MSCKIDFSNEWDLKYQGAESKIYFGLHSNNRCVIKHRFSKAYRHPALDKKLTRERTKRERRMIEKIQGKSSYLASYMPKIVWSDSSTLLMTEIQDCISLHDFIEKEQQPSESIFELAPLIGRCVAELHNLKIIHGDLTTSNLLLVSKSNKSNNEQPVAKKQEEVPSKKIKTIEDLYVVVPIDFGLSTGSEHPEERAVDLYVLERALLTTHFSDSTFFQNILNSYITMIDESTCQPHGKNKIMERLREVRNRGRKSGYSDEQEA